LHNSILNDEGVPDLENHRNNLLRQINNKLTLIKQIMDERKFLVKKADQIPQSKFSKKFSPVSSPKHPNSDSLDEKDMKKIMRQREAEEKIKKIQNSMGNMNLHRVESEELNDLPSIESSNIDYTEIFEEKFRIVDSTFVSVNNRFNQLVNKIDDKNANLERIIKSNDSRIEQYVNTLHQEFDRLTDFTSNFRLNF
jgi:hypothetical protein